MGTTLAISVVRADHCSPENDLYSRSQRVLFTPTRSVHLQRVFKDAVLDVNVNDCGNCGVCKLEQDRLRAEALWTIFNKCKVTAGLGLVPTADALFYRNTSWY
ncbi:hypothetical protein EVAR_13810_1 [Eumeta japonica]|uniref:Uncharacterized protein n=1 Tax=Eumeta variegata TaxID=151549 RepID=A0A4C1U0Z6_EUMVA|nr:hypothetical protein EVAR_13810_1 [Eumeta japonica]